MSGYSIGNVADMLDLSVDTLRYYEKIGLLRDVSRTESGIRRYDDSHLATLRFIKRAQVMNFSLAEIGALLEFRKNPGRSRRDVRDLALAKLEEINSRLRSLNDLGKELSRLVDACPGHEGGCAIISGIERRKLDGHHGTRPLK